MTGWALAAALGGFFAGGLLQTATGYGFAILAAPALAGVVAPEDALPTLVIVGTLVNAVLVTEAWRGERPTIDVRLATWLFLLSLPGVVLGVALLLAASVEVLRACIAVAVLGAAAARLSRPTVVGPRRGETAVAGVLSGVLGGSVGFNGPPLVILLLRRGTSPDVARGTLASFFVFCGLPIAGVLVVRDAFDPLAATPLLLAAALVGQALGRPLRAPLAAHHEHAQLAVLAFAGLVALVSAVASLA